jgi:hypothetical protein
MPADLEASWKSIREKMAKYTGPENQHLYVIPIDGLEEAREHMVLPTTGLGLAHSVNFILGDGNSLFRAIAQWQFGDQQFHRVFRNHAKEHRGWMQKFLEGAKEYKKWIKKMGKEGWNDSTALTAIAKQYRIIIFLIYFEAHKGLPDLDIHHPDPLPSAILATTIRNPTPVYFLLCMDNHYEIVDPYQ